MTLNEFTQKCVFELVTKPTENVELTKVYCCDLLSFAMTRNPAGSVWVTVMGNLNSVAVASLTEGGCIVVAEGATVDETAVAKAKEQGICILKTDMPVFDAALLSHGLSS